MKKFFTLVIFCMLSASTYAQAMYCTPTYTTGTTVGDSIISFQLGTIVGDFPG